MCDVRAADVRAETDWHARGEVCLCERDDAVEDDLAVFLLLIRRVRNAAVEERVGQGGGNGRNLERLALLEECDHFIAWLRAVLDGVDAVLQRDHHALRALNVRRDDHAERMCLVARGLDKLGLHAQHARLTHDFGVQHAAGDHQLDEVGLFGGDLFDERRGLFGGVRLVGERTRHVPAGDGDRHVRRQHARGKNFARRGEVANFRVVIGDAADCADGRDAGEQLGFGVALAHVETDFIRQRAGGDELDELFRVARLLLGPARGGQMHVHVDETRQHIFSAEVDCLIARGDMLCVDDLADLLSGDAHGLARLRLHVLRAVEKHAVCQCVLFVVMVHRSVRLSCYRIWPLPVMTYL